MLYVVCNDFYQNEEECVCCICGSRKMAERKINEYIGNFMMCDCSIPNFWIREIPSQIGEEDFIEFN